jgi:diguanylate cyclase (GGDEF)-like protein
VLAGPDLLQFVTLSPNRQLRVGRDHSTDLPLTHVTVSKLHARIAVDATGQATVFDLKSTNGTAVNGRRVRRAPLRPGDRLEVGDVPLRLDLLSRDELNHLSRVCERFDAPGRDPNTGLSPLGYLETDLPTFVSRCERSSTALSSLYIEIDHYSEIQVRHGTAVSELVLQGVARLTALAVRDADPCVTGGSGVIHVFLKGSTLTSAAEVAERIRRTIAGHDWARDAPNLLVTASIGVAARLPNEGMKQWLGRSESAARQPSNAGRNRVEQAMARGNLREVIEAGM